MQNIEGKKIISITELQKLSLKKLRRMGAPLFVKDVKSGREAFMIIPSQARPPRIRSGQSERKRRLNSLGAYDFRAKGLFWDRSDMTNNLYATILKNPQHQEYVWAISRLLERMPSQEVIRLFSLLEISQMLKMARIREFIKKPWEHAFEYYRQKARSYR